MRLICLVEHYAIFVIANGNDPLTLRDTAQPGKEKLVDFLMHCEVFIFSWECPPLPGTRKRVASDLALACAPAWLCQQSKTSTFRRRPMATLRHGQGDHAHGGSYVNDCQQKLWLMVAPWLAPMQTSRPRFR